MTSDDRYRAPRARLADRDNTSDFIERPLGLLATAIIVPFALIFAATIVANSMPGYDETFTQLGLQLTWLTRLALRSQWIFSALAVLASLLAIAIVRTPQAKPERFRSLRRRELLLIAVSALAGGIVAWGILEPLMRLGSVV